jgi:hypothetical protein
MAVVLSGCPKNSYAKGAIPSKPGESAQHDSGGWPKPSSFKLQASSFKLQASSFKLHAPSKYFQQKYYSAHDYVIQKYINVFLP